MKLRQKLAVVLATAMVASAVPVVTMAASDNGMLREVLKVKEDTTFTESSTAAGIQIKLKDAWQGKSEVFYLTISNAEWDDDARLAMVRQLSDASAESAKKNVNYPLFAADQKGNSIVKDGKDVDDTDIIGTYTFDGKKTVKVVLFGVDTDLDAQLDTMEIADGEYVLSEVVKSDAMVRFPLLVTAKGGDAKVKLEKSGSTSTITDGEWTFATTAEKKFSFTASDAEVVYEKGVLADVTFSENFSGAFTTGNTAAIEYELQDGDYKFDFVSGINGVTYVSGNKSIPGSTNTDKKYTQYHLTKNIELSYGFIGQDVTVDAYVNNDDEGECVFVIKAGAGVKSDSIGKVKLKDIPVRNDEKEIVEGDLLVDIQNYGYGTEDLLDNGKNDVKLGKIVAYSNYIKMKDEKAKDVVAGRVEEIEFEIGEYIDDSMVGDREFEITLVDDLAHFNYDKNEVLYTYNYATGTYGHGEKGKDGILDDQSDYKLNDSDSKKIKLVESIKVDPDHNNILKVKLNPKAQINGEKDKLKLKIKVCVPVANKDAEKVTIKAEGRALEKACETTAINIVNPFNVKAEEMRVKVGLQNQVGGKVTITETDKEMFNKGNMYLKVVDPATGRTVDGITFYTDKESKEYVTYTTTGDIKKADLDTVVENGAATIKLKRQSKSASTLDLKDFHVTVDRTVPQGKYDLVLTGDAISEHYYATANTNTADAKVSTSTTTTLTPVYKTDADGNDVLDANGNKIVDKYVSSTTTTSSNVKYANDSKYPYVDDKQAQEHQIVVKDFFVVGTPNTEDIAANGLRKGTASFVIGESKYVANGEEITMDAASFIQQNYTMIPVRYVAEAFGITTDNILFSNGTATIFAGERTIQLTNGSDIAVVNGASIKMGTKVTIKDGRTYAPVGEVARILGIKTDWKAETKTAQFINE